MQLSRSLRLVCAWLVLAAVARADVLIVDHAGGGDFLDIQSAIDAAVDGDILMVKPADYAFIHLFGINLGDKSLSIIADGEAGPGFTVAFLDIRGLSAGKSLLLRGLNIAPVIGGPSAVHVEDCDGVVQLEDCTLTGQMATTFFTFPFGSGVSVVDSAGVSLHRCTVTGGAGHDFFQLSTATTDGAAGVTVVDSNVSIADCVVVGGRGGDDVSPTSREGANGAPGLYVLGGSSVVLSGSEFTGGRGGSNCDDPVPTGCLAGPGRLIQGPGPFVQDLDTTYAGGAGGTLQGGGSQPDGVPEVLAGPSTIIPHAGQAVSVHKVFPLRTGETGTMTVSGAPNTLFAVFFGFEPAYLPLFHFKGVFHASLPIEGPYVLDVLDGAGSFSVDYVAPAIAPFGLEGLVFVDQVLNDQGADGVVLGSATSHVQVDTGF